MNIKSIFATCCVAGIASGAAAQDVEFTQYLGFISVTTAPLPLASDTAGRLYYGTFNTNNNIEAVSQLRVIEDPVNVIDTATSEGVLIDSYPEFANGRGLQSLQVTPDGTIFVGGDTGDAALANVWKYNRTSEAPLTFVEDPAFQSNVILESPKRRHGVAVISTTGNGLLAASHFTGVDFFDFSGDHLNGLGGGTAYIREIVYNSQDNILYPMRNGANSNNMIDFFFTGFSTTDGSGGSIVNSTLIDDGASNSTFGSATQNGFYFQEQHQLITLDGATVQNDPPRVRVWDINDNGTSLSLAYSIETDPNGQPFTGIADAVVINNRLYVSNTSRNAIYVYGAVPASINRWDAYEAAH